MEYFTKWSRLHDSPDKHEKSEKKKGLIFAAVTFTLLVVAIYSLAILLG